MRRPQQLRQGAGERRTSARHIMPIGEIPVQILYLIGSRNHALLMVRHRQYVGPSLTWASPSA